MSVSRFASSRRIPPPHRVVLDLETVGPGRRERQHELRPVVGVDDRKPFDAVHPLAEAGGQVERLREELLAPRRHQVPGPVQAREDGRGRARRVQEIEGLADPGQVEPVSLREEVGALREGRQRLVRRHDHCVRAEREAVRREPGVEAEVRPQAWSTTSGTPASWAQPGEARPRR